MAEYCKQINTVIFICLENVTNLSCVQAVTISFVFIVTGFVYQLSSRRFG